MKQRIKYFTTRLKIGRYTLKFHNYSIFTTLSLPALIQQQILIVRSLCFYGSYGENVCNHAAKFWLILTSSLLPMVHSTIQGMAASPASNLQ